MTKNSARQKMTKKVPIVKATDTVGKTLSYVIKNIGQFETINYLYVVDKEGKLTGVFSLKDLYKQPPATKVSKIYKKALVTVLPTTDPEAVAYLALQHNIKAVPVVDKKSTFLGVIPSSTILAILYKELREDILRLAGVPLPSRSHFDNIFEIPLGEAIRHRIPWLFVGLLGGLLAAKIIGHFEKTLEKNLLLATFIPLVVYMADAVGTQLEAFVIRDFALFRKLNFRRYFLKQFLIVFVVSLLLGSFLILATFILYQKLNLAVVLGVAIIAATLSALFSGLSVPYLFRKFSVDPANASGPIGTIIQDILSVFIYFLIASWLL